MTPRPTHAIAAQELAERHPPVRSLVEAVGFPRIARPAQSHFASLVRAIVYQQLAGKAAAAIHGRLIGALDGDVTPDALVALDAEDLRTAGLSANKAAALRDLATKVIDGTVILDSRKIARESDEEVIERLLTVRGIGRWTAQMFLLFQLRRLDVWPAGDLGVRRGYGLAWGVSMPTEKQLEPLGETFRPYRSVVAWYCWRACEVYTGAGESALSR